MAQTHFTHDELEEIRSEVKKGLKKNLESMVEAEVKKQLRSNAGKNEIKEITTKVLVNLFRILWNRSSMWEKSV